MGSKAVTSACDCQRAEVKRQDTALSTVGKVTGFVLAQNLGDDREARPPRGVGPSR